MSLEVYPKIRKRSRTVSPDAEKKYTFNRETPVLISSILCFYSRNILPKYHLCLKINRIISIQVCCLIINNKLS
jgi:hypothetical protein